jgi:hypothetical protein
VHLCVETALDVHAELLQVIPLRHLALKRPQTSNLSFFTPTSISTNHTLGKSKPHFCPIMTQQQPPVPNIANLQAAVNRMTLQEKIIAQGHQAYDAHHPALNTDLSRCGNNSVAGIQQQLTAIRASIANLSALFSAE